MQISILLPYFNKAFTLPKMAAQIEELRVALGQGNIRHEFVLVDDGSDVEQAGALDECLKHSTWPLQFIRLDKNQGKSAALLAAARQARGDQLVWLDADAAFESADVLGIIAASLAAPSAVWVADRSRALQTGASPVRRMMSRAFRRLARSILGVTIPDIQAGLKVIPREWFLRQTWESGGFGLDLEVIRTARKSNVALHSFPVSRVNFEGHSSVQPVRAALSLAAELLRPIFNRAWVAGALLVLLTNLRAFSTRSSVPWDARDEMWFYFRWLGSAARAGYFGDFIPNIVSGYPIGANIQAGTYNPLYLFFAGAFPDSVLSINLLYLALQFLLYGVSFVIGHTYGWKPVVSAFFALCLVASGYTTGHASHFSYLSSLLGFLALFLGSRMATRNHVVLAFGPGLLGCFHLFTAGYPAIIAFGAQCIGAYWLWALWRNPLRRKALAIFAGGCVLGVAFAGPSLWHFWNQLQQSPRGAGLDVATALSGSLPRESLLNFLWPGMKMDLTYADSVDPTMDRFHLLYLSPILLLLAWYAAGRRLLGERKQVWAWSVAGTLFLVLALGKNFLPLREWLARALFLYRAGRFPSGEHRGFAIFALAIVSTLGFQYLYGRLRGRWKGILLAVVALDFIAVMAATARVRYTRLAPELQGTVDRFQIEYTAKDQPLIDAPRGCPFLPQNEYDQRKTPPHFFSWNGYTNLYAAKYSQEREGARWALCAGPRLWNPASRAPIAYRLELYSPSRLVIRVDTDRVPPERTLLWADVTDGFWRASVNGIPAQLGPGPAALRLIEIPGGIDLAASKALVVEMSYHGPLSRLWRR